MVDQSAFGGSNQPDKSVRGDVDVLVPVKKLWRPARKANAARGIGAIEMPVLTALVFAALLYGWLQSDEGHINAESGTGYYLGIAGSLLMLSLLLYPLRKRFRLLRGLGSVRAWFRIHMLLGVIGPALIVLHSNFTLGSLNSSVALWAMLIVATSGFAGRFFYSRIHRGLYGHKLNAKELTQNVLDIRESFALDADTMVKFEAEISNFGGRLARGKLKRRLECMLLERIENSGVSATIKQERLADFEARLAQYFRAVSRAKTFEIYERLFSLWHMLHLPLFIVLVLAALIHILAVHLY